MIATLQGTVSAVEDDGIIIETGGIGFLVGVPLSTLERFPEIGDELKLHTYLQVKDDGWMLFGFPDKEQLSMFRLLLTVTGVGAKMALAILDRLRPGNVAAAVNGNDTAAFTAVSGVGKKRAERIILELKDKVAAFAFAQAPAPVPVKEGVLNQDLLNALRQLGYTATESRAFAMKAQEALGDNADDELLLREALKIAMRS